MSKITMDATAKAQQDQLKQNVVALIMNESTVLTEVQFDELNHSISEVTITYMTGEVEFI